MNYYKRHIGDLAKDCANLSQGQMGAYGLLLDFYYANERPLPLDREQLVRIARCFTAAERRNLDVILPLFERRDDGYHSKRADEEIADYHAFVERQTAKGKKGGRPPKNKGQAQPTDNPAGNPVGNPPGFDGVPPGKPGENPIHNPQSTNPPSVPSGTEVARVHAGDASRTYPAGFEPPPRSWDELTPVEQVRSVMRRRKFNGAVPDSMVETYVASGGTARALVDLMSEDQFYDDPDGARIPKPGKYLLKAALRQVAEKTDVIVATATVHATVTPPRESGQRRALTRLNPNRQD